MTGNLALNWNELLELEAAITNHKVGLLQRTEALMTPQQREDLDRRLAYVRHIQRRIGMLKTAIRPLGQEVFDETQSEEGEDEDQHQEG